jgi:hypothetical protein
VVDIENVCRAGREIAAENKLRNRITYLAADYLQDELPAGFDMVMLCDLSSFSQILFRKSYDALNANGHLVTVEKFAPSRTTAPPSRLLSAFLDSLQHPSQSIDFTTVEVVQSRLRKTSYRDFSVNSVPHIDNLPWNIDWIVLEARK